MTLRPTTWVALLAAAVLVFGAAVVLIGLGPAGGTPAGQTSSPTAPVAVASPTGAPGASASPTDTPLPQVTPTPEPTPPSTDKIGPPLSADPQDLTGYVWPLRKAWITSRFAPRDFGTFLLIDGVGYHDGLDLATHCGDEIRAAHDGRVIYAGRDFDAHIGYLGTPGVYERLEKRGRANALAIAVVIDDGNGYRSLYMHLSKTSVEPGQVVSAGDEIGKEGMTGAATGCHLHYALIRMDGPWQEVMPRLHKYGYPPFIREHVNPLDVLPWDDPYAPQRLRDRVNPPSSTPTPASPAPPTVPSSAAPTGSPGPL